MTRSDTYDGYTADGFAASEAENYERHFVPVIGTPFARRLLEVARLSPGERVLDVACGTGIAARLAAEAVGPTGTVTGCDVNPGMLEVARATAPAATGITWHEAPADHLGLPDSSFDVVVCSLGFMFFPDKPLALREMHRVLAPGGRVVLGTPGPTPPLMQAIDQALITHVGPGASMFVHAVFSVHDPGEVRELLESAGFEDIGTTIDTVALRVPPPAEFFWQYVHCTPLATVIAELDGDARSALEADVVERCQEFADGDATVMEPRLLLATGTRPGDAR